MSGDTGEGGGFLRRWSQRKLAAARQATATPPAEPANAQAAATASPSADAPPGTPVATTVTQPQAVAEVPGIVPGEVPELPAVETLGFDSDYTRFLAPQVDETLKRRALRKLFSDPRFNVMDGLDVYIDDYSKSEPIPPDLVAMLKHARYVFDPPKTRLNEAGHVEDVPDEIAAAETRADRDGESASQTSGAANGTDVSGVEPADGASTTMAAEIPDANAAEGSRAAVADAPADAPAAAGPLTVADRRRIR